MDLPEPSSDHSPGPRSESSASSPPSHESEHRKERKERFWPKLPLIQNEKRIDHGQCKSPKPGFLIFFLNNLESERNDQAHSKDCEKLNCICKGCGLVN